MLSFLKMSTTIYSSISSYQSTIGVYKLLKGEHLKERKHCSIDVKMLNISCMVVGSLILHYNRLNLMSNSLLNDKFLDFRFRLFSLDKKGDSNGEICL